MSMTYLPKTMSWGGYVGVILALFPAGLLHAGQLHAKERQTLPAAAVAVTEQAVLSFMDAWAAAQASEEFDNLEPLIHREAV